MYQMDSRESHPLQYSHFHMFYSQLQQDGLLEYTDYDGEKQSHSIIFLDGETSKLKLKVQASGYKKTAIDSLA